MVTYTTSRLSDDFSALRQKLWRAHRALSPLLRLLQVQEFMVQGSFYLLRRRCGKPNCRCARGQLHERWVLTRSEAGKSRIYSVPAAQRARLRRLTREYRRYQRGRAALVKRAARLVELIDILAAQRLLDWPREDLPDEPGDH